MEWSLGGKGRARKDEKKNHRKKEGGEIVLSKSFKTMTFLEARYL